MEMESSSYSVDLSGGCGRITVVLVILMGERGGCVKTLAQPLLYFTVLLYFLLAMLLFPHAFGNKLLYSNYIGL